MNRPWILSVLILFLIAGIPTLARAQSSGSVEGFIALPTGDPVGRATVLLSGLDRVAETDANGRFRFDNVPVGTYGLVAYRWLMSAEVDQVLVGQGQTGNVRMQLGSALVVMETARPADPARLAEAPEAGLVASANSQSLEVPVNAVQNRSTPISTFDMTRAGASTLGDAMDSRLGFNTRSFGQSISRPIFRGFDGDRVLILGDGLSGGSLAYHSGDHFEPFAPGTIERIEFLRGPSTLLYGNSLVGRAINVVGPGRTRTPASGEGWRGRTSSGFGFGDAYAGSSVQAEYASGNWQFSLAGSSRRAGDYDSPLGSVENSGNGLADGSVGITWFDDSAFMGFNYSVGRGSYGIPVAPEFRSANAAIPIPDAVDVEFRRHGVELFGGARAEYLAFEGFEFSASYSYWDHDEIETFNDVGPSIATNFGNRVLSYRAWFDQKRAGVLDGRIGFSTSTREYRANGREQLLPSVRRNNLAVFAVEELDLSPFLLEMGGRIDYAGDGVRGLLTRRINPLDADAGFAQDFFRGRSFVGGTGSLGASVQAWDIGEFRVDLTSGYRQPAIEELYSFGAHVGRLTFDIGDVTLRAERSNGAEISFTHTRPRFSAEMDVFYYDIKNFVYFGLNQNFLQGLMEAEYQQGPARFSGVELALDFQLHRSTRLKVGMETVQATLRDLGTSPPRLPPFRARFGLDYRLGGLRFSPELIVADSREEVFSGENPTPGYGLVNMAASYTLPRENMSHQFAFNVFNLGDKLYRDHNSLLKRLVPAWGRGFRITYAMEFTRPAPSGGASSFDQEGLGLAAGGPTPLD